MAGWLCKRPFFEVEKGGVQAETTIYFVVWWVLFEYGSFGHFPQWVFIVLLK